MDIFVYITLCFTSLFTLMDPLGVMPVFLQMTDGMDTKERRCIALKACTIAFIILVLFTLSGRFLFHFFGISTDGFRIVGGIIIFKIGYDMLQAHFTHVKLNETERKEYSKDITITPLAIPMLCGPGAISSGITSVSYTHLYRSRSERIVQVNHRLRKIKEREREKLLSDEGLK